MIPNAKKFQPGQSGNPKGGSRKASERKMLKALINKADMEEIGKLILQGKLKQLQAIVDDANASKGGKQRHSVMKMMFASIALRAIAKGDVNAMNGLLDRLMGKVPAPVQLTSPDGSMRPTVILRLPDNGRRAKGSDEPSGND